MSGALHGNRGEAPVRIVPVHEAICSPVENALHRTTTMGSEIDQDVVSLRHGEFRPPLACMCLRT